MRPLTLIAALASFHGVMAAQSPPTPERQATFTATWQAPWVHLDPVGIPFGMDFDLDLNPVLAYGFDQDDHLSPDHSFGLDLHTPVLAGLHHDLDWQAHASFEAVTALGVGVTTSNGRRLAGSERLSALRPQQGTAADSAYRAGREALNRGEYLRASEIFRQFHAKFPTSRFAPAALYWQAFALYRVGTEDRLLEARRALETTRSRYSQAANDADVSSLLLRVQAALASRGDAEAAANLQVTARELRASGVQGVDCDKEEMEVRSEALNALVRMGEAEARPILERVLARRDECSIPLRRRAIYHIGRSGSANASAMLISVIENDPSEQVKVDAISLLGRISSPANLSALQRLIQSSDEQRIQRAAISAIRQQETPEALATLRNLIESAQMDDRLRSNAIGSLSAVGRYSWKEEGTKGQWSYSQGRSGPRQEVVEANGAYLRALYPKVTEARLKRSVISGIARIGGETNIDWLLALAGNQNEDVSYRSYALSQIRTGVLSVAQIGQMYEASTSRPVRTRLISLLSSHKDSTATDKLLEIARQGTDPTVRRAAISALVNRKDPRATRLLLELVEK